jgi:hypothetical protein
MLGRIGDSTLSLRPAFNFGQASQAGETMWDDWWFPSGVSIIPRVVFHRKQQGAQ